MSVWFHPPRSIPLFTVNGHTGYADPVSFIHVIHRVEQTHRKQEVSGAVKERREMKKKIQSHVYVYTNIENKG